MSTPENGFDFQKSMKNVQSYPFIHKYLPFDRYLIRPPASVIVKIVFSTSITPNHLTLISFFFAMLAGLAFLGARPLYFALGGSLALVSTIFDAADGMLARAKGMTSRYGAFLDLFLDRVADWAVLTGASFGYFRYTGSVRFLAFGLVTVGLYLLQLNLYYINNVYTRAQKSGEGAEAKSLTVILIFVFSIIGRPDGFLAGVFLLGLLGTLIKLVRFLRKGRDPEAAQFR